MPKSLEKIYSGSQVFINLEYQILEKKNRDRIEKKDKFELANSN